MKPYTKNYMDFFGYSPGDFMPCEMCGATAVDIAHIVPKGRFGSKKIDERDHIRNCMALCRSCHYDYDFRNRWTREEMTETHNHFIKLRKP